MFFSVCHFLVGFMGQTLYCSLFYCWVVAFLSKRIQFFFFSQKKVPLVRWVPVVIINWMQPFQVQYTGIQFCPYIFLRIFHNFAVKAACTQEYNFAIKGTLQTYIFMKSYIKTSNKKITICHLAQILHAQHLIFMYRRGGGA